MRADRIVIAAARAYGVDVNDVLGPHRAHAGNVRSARIAAVATLRERRGMSYPEIARTFRRTFHTGVYGWHREFTDVMTSDARADMVARMTQALAEEERRGH